MKDKKNKRKLEEGEILVNTIIEIIGKPKKHVEDTIKAYIEKIEQNKDFTVVKKDIAKVKKYEGEMFSSFAELEIIFQDIGQIHYFCFDYMPASIEIIEPEIISYDAYKLTGVINEFQSRLHSLDMALKEMKQINDHMNYNFTNLLNNHIMLILKGGEKTIEQLEKLVGVKAEKLKIVMAYLEQRKIVRKEQDKYRLNI